ncbi:MAG: LytR/AlgR family response regulator transcription factor [Salibacteraceae bacterium]
MLKTLIADDELLARKLIGQFSERCGKLDVIGSFANGIEVRELLKEEQVDLIFLDIEMPGLSGIDLLRSTPVLPQVILTTHHKEYALEAFEYDITDYLVKPIHYSRFLKAVEKAERLHDLNLESAKKEVQKEFFVKVDSRLLKIDGKGILFIEAYGDYVKIHLHDKKLLAHTTMTSFEQTLPQTEFVRVHRRYIVRLDQINELRKTSIMVNDKEIPVSKSYRQNLLDKLRFV